MILAISTLEFAEMQKIIQNKKKSHLGPKMPYLRILRCKFEKVLSSSNQHPRICQNVKIKNS